LFPEILDFARKSELLEASSIGPYIFHEDFFVPFILAEPRGPDFLSRVGKYIEYLIANENRHLRDLGEIGVVQCLIHKGFSEIVPFWGIETEKILILNRLNLGYPVFDLNIWTGKARRKKGRRLGLK